MAARDFRFGFVFFGGLRAERLRRALSAAQKDSRAGNRRFFRSRHSPGTRHRKAGMLFFGGLLPRQACGAFSRRQITDPQCLVDPGLLGVPLHPTQLYEKSGQFHSFSGFFTECLFQNCKKAGGCAGAYLAGYAMLRFAVEFLRGDERGGFLSGMSPAQWISLAVILACARVLQIPSFKSGEVIFYAKKRNIQI